MSTATAAPWDIPAARALARQLAVAHRGMAHLEERLAEIEAGQVDTPAGFRRWCVETVYLTVQYTEEKAASIEASAVKGGIVAQSTASVPVITAQSTAEEIQVWLIAEGFMPGAMTDDVLAYVGGMLGEGRLQEDVFTRLSHLPEAALAEGIAPYKVARLLGEHVPDQRAMGDGWIDGLLALAKTGATDDALRAEIGRRLEIQNAVASEGQPQDAALDYPVRVLEHAERLLAERSLRISVTEEPIVVGAPPAEPIEAYRVTAANPLLRNEGPGVERLERGVETAEVAPRGPRGLHPIGVAPGQIVQSVWPDTDPLGRIHAGEQEPGRAITGQLDTSPSMGLAVNGWEVLSIIGAGGGARFEIRVPGVMHPTPVDVLRAITRWHEAHMAVPPGCTCREIQAGDPHRHFAGCSHWTTRPMAPEAAPVAPARGKGPPIDHAEAVARELRPAVLRFAAAMEQKLRENDRTKGDWQDEGALFLLKRLYQEAEELAVEEGRPERNRRALRREAADVGNLAMMLADNEGDLAAFNPLAELGVARSATSPGPLMVALDGGPEVDLAWPSTAPPSLADAAGNDAARARLQILAARCACGSAAHDECEHKLEAIAARAWPPVATSRTVTIVTGYKPGPGDFALLAAGGTLIIEERIALDRPARQGASETRIHVEPTGLARHLPGMLRTVLHAVAPARK